MTLGAESAPGMVMNSKGLKAGRYHTPMKTGFLSLNNDRPNPSVKMLAPSDGMKCTHCDKAKHTRETCFKLHGYPDWWHELQTRKKRDTPNGSTGRVAIATGEPSLSLTSHAETTHNSGNNINVLHSSTHTADDNWILDSRATDHMTFDSNDFSHTTLPRRSHVATANGVPCSVTGAGTVTLSPSLSLPHTLLVPSLSHKLMSVSQVTADLNCVVLIYSTFYLLQDILTKEIIGRGTKRGDYIMSMTSVQAEQTSWIMRLARKNNRFGYGIIA
jgi:hypothetical protein